MIKYFSVDRNNDENNSRLSENYQKNEHKINKILRI